MTVQTLHIPLPEAIVQRLQHVAETTHRPLEEVVVQTICGYLPPTLEDLSPALREVVADLPTLSDEALWAVARTPVPPQQWRRHQQRVSGSFYLVWSKYSHYPSQVWTRQIARNVAMEEWGFLSRGQYLMHDRDGKYCSAFQQRIDAAGVTRVPLPPRSPNLNAYAERWVQSVKDEALSWVILFGEASLWHVLHEYVEHYHHERNHQGKGHVLLFPTVSPADMAPQGPLQCRERLGGLLKYYEREAA
jgi:transposase InsO family protein